MPGAKVFLVESIKYPLQGLPLFSLQEKMRPRLLHYITADNSFALKVVLEFSVPDLKASSSGHDVGLILSGMVCGDYISASGTNRENMNCVL